MHHGDFSAEVSYAACLPPEPWPGENHKVGEGRGGRECRTALRELPVQGMQSLGRTPWAMLWGHKARASDTMGFPGVRLRVLGPVQGGSHMWVPGEVGAYQACPPSVLSSKASGGKQWGLCWNIQLGCLSHHESLSYHMTPTLRRGMQCSAGCHALSLLWWTWYRCRPSSSAGFLSRRWQGSAVTFPSCDCHLSSFLVVSQPATLLLLVPDQDVLCLVTKLSYSGTS